MKKIILYSCLILVISSCSKKDTSIDSSNSWTFAGKTYKAANVSYTSAGSEANLSASATGATSTSANGLVFDLINPPTQSTQMLITNTIAPNTLIVSISNLSGTNTTFYTNSVTNVNATVTVSNGKYSISFPGTIWLHNDSNFSDSAQLSVGTITQQ